MLPIGTSTESGSGHWEPILASVQGKYLFMMPIGTGTESGPGHWELTLASLKEHVFVYTAYRHWHMVTDWSYLYYTSDFIMSQNFNFLSFNYSFLGQPERH